MGKRIAFVGAVAFVSVKSYDTEWATLLIRQYLASGGFIVSLQNCINEERIAQHVGWGRTETDYINGYVAARGMEIGVPAPLHARMNELVRRVECGVVRPAPEHITGW